MFKLLKMEGKARRGEFTCAHGTVQTPVFMNVGTQGAIKGALSAKDLKEIGCQVELSNTYHLIEVNIIQIKDSVTEINIIHGTDKQILVVESSVSE